MFNLKKKSIFRDKMSCVCPKRSVRTFVLLGMLSAPVQFVAAQFNLSLSNPSLGTVIKEIQAPSDY